MAYLYNKMPISAYVKLKIAGDMGKDENSGDHDWDVESVLSPDDDGSSDNQVVIEFSWRKPGSGSGENAFNITAFDDTAIYLESQIVSGRTGIHIEYGWCAGGEPVPGRSMTIYGMLKEYSISFQGPSTELNIVGYHDTNDFLAKSSTRDFPASIYHGNPSNILRTICEENGWDASGIVDTVDVMESGSMKKPKTYLQGSRSLKEFINSDLCVDARTKDGQSAFKFYIDWSVDPPKAYFRPETELSAGDIEITMRDENGHTGKKSYAGGKSKQNDSNVTREFNYYAGQENNEIISFTPNYTFAAPQGLHTEASTINPETGELFACDIKGSTMVIEEGEDSIATMNGSRLLGMSSGGFYDLANRSKRLWSLFANMSVTATLEIMGDPQFKPIAENSNTVNINVYTKYGIKHHTSGKYYIEAVQESVSGGMYITSLELRKVLASSKQNNIVEETPEDGNKENKEKERQKEKEKQKRIEEKLKEVEKKQKEIEEKQKEIEEKE